MHVGLTDRLKKQAAPMLDNGLSALLADMDERGLLEENLVIAVGEFGRAPQTWREHQRKRQQCRRSRSLAVLLHSDVAGAGVKRGFVYGKSDKTASGPLENAVHPTDLLATIYHALGIEPATIVYNHLNQPREMVQGNVVTGIFG